MAGRAFLMLCYPLAMAHFIAPLAGAIDGIDGMTAATPLAAFKTSMAAGTFQSLDFQDALLNLFIGRCGGSIGETSAAALLMGAIILWYRRIISLRIPLAFVGTVLVLSWLTGGTGDLFSTDGLVVPVYQILAGGLMMGAFFMATDPVSSPFTPLGKVWFGIGCGILTFLFRRYSAYPEGVTYAILAMNCTVPLLDRITRPRIFGEARHRV
jgi:electron transport complex protein RnfD